MDNHHTKIGEPPVIGAYTLYVEGDYSFDQRVIERNFPLSKLHKKGRKADCPPEIKRFFTPLSILSSDVPGTEPNQIQDCVDARILSRNGAQATTLASQMELRYLSSLTSSWESSIRDFVNRTTAMGSPERVKLLKNMLKKKLFDVLTPPNTYGPTIVPELPMILASDVNGEKCQHAPTPSIIQLSRQAFFPVSMPPHLFWDVGSDEDEHFSMVAYNLCFMRLVESTFLRTSALTIDAQLQSVISNWVVPAIYIDADPQSKKLEAVCHLIFYDRVEKEIKWHTKTYNIGSDVRSYYRLGLLLLNIRRAAEEMAVHRGFNGFFALLNHFEVVKTALRNRTKDMPMRAARGNVTQISDLPQFSNLGKFDLKVSDRIQQEMTHSRSIRVWPSPSAGYVSNYVGKRSHMKELEILDHLADVQGVIPVMYDGPFADRLLTDIDSDHLIITPWAGHTLPSYPVTSAEVAHRIALDLLKILQQVHTHGIAHLSLTPDNILIDKRYTNHPLNLVGFSSAVWDTEDLEDGLYRRQAGSPGWQAPEVLSGEPYDPFCADLWSLGHVLRSVLAEYCESTAIKTIVDGLVRDKPRTRMTLQQAIHIINGHQQ
ncbi:Serine/threonine-protein kinase brsk1 [Marasmius sp. AFHP31]|nr:Serine/threonine-protein kinase brsk1 [Marasmius sp. AFHP31]